MMPAAKALDPLLGIDIHIMQPPPPAPPVPLPNPYIGMVFDPMDFVPFLGATTRIGGLPRAQAGTAGQALPPHLPLGGVFVKPPSNESEIFMGSATVAIDGDAASYMALPVLSCVDVGMVPPPRLKASDIKSLVLPMTKVLAIPGPVMIGGFPTISLTAMAGRAGLGNLLLLYNFIASGCDPMILVGFFAGKLMGKLQDVANKALGKLTNKLFDKVKGKFKGKAQPPHGPNAHPPNGAACTTGNPVDSFTGEYYENYLDAAAGGEALFRWKRHYSSAICREFSPVGAGFRHSYMAKLELFAQAYRFETFDRRAHFFTPVTEVGEESKANGYVMKRVARDRITIARRGAPTLHFDCPLDGAPRLVLLSQGTRRLLLEYDGEQLTGLQEGVIDSGVARPLARYLIQYYPNGLLYALYRVDDPTLGATQAGYTLLAGYQYDPQGQLIRSQNALGGVHALHYDVNGRVVSMTDPRGYAFSWRYDDQGRCVETTGQDGLWWAKLQYFPGETHIQECSPGTFIHKFNSSGTLIEIVDPYGGVLTRELDKQGRVVRETDSGGRVTEWLYDENGYHYARRNQYAQLVPPEDEAGKLPNPHAPKLPRTAVEREWGLVPDNRASLGPSTTLLRIATLDTARAVSAALPVATERDKPQRRYNDRGNLIEEIEPNGRRRTWEYDACGNLVQTRDADGRVRTQEIVRWNLVGARVDALGQTVRYQYADNEAISGIVDQLGNVTTYEYDDKERLVRVRRAGVVEDEYIYDAGDRLVEKRDGQGQTLLRFEHDDRSLVKHVVLADGAEHFLAFDSFGKPTLASTSEHEVSIERDSFGGIVSDLVDGLGIEVARSDDAIVFFGRFRFRRALYGQTISRSGSTQLLVWRDPTRRKHILEYDPTGLSRRVTPAGTVEFARFDNSGHIDARVVERHSPNGPPSTWVRHYRRSAEGDLLAIDDSVTGRTEFHVDHAHRLVGESSARGNFAYRLDAAGNLLEKPGLNGVSVGPHNTLQRANDSQYVYNARTHIAEVFDTASGQTTRYTYNARDLLTRIEVGRVGPDGWLDELAPWTAEYDAIGRRLSSGRQGARRRYFWRGNQLVAEIPDSGPLRLYIYADEKAWVPMFFVDYASLDADPATGSVYSIFGDHLGVPVAVEDAAGRLVWQARPRDAYGNLELSSDNVIELSLRWPGHYCDADTGLFYNRYRYYDPQLGRYLQADPIGQSGGVNVYAYAPNPLRDVDLLGLAHSEEKGGKSSGDEGDANPTKKAPEAGDPLVHDPTKKDAPDEVHTARAKQEEAAALAASSGNEHKTVAVNGGNHLSGYDVDGKPTPDGFSSTGRDPETNLAHEKEIGHQSPANSSVDPKQMDNGDVAGARKQGDGETMPGGMASTHAERQSTMGMNNGDPSASQHHNPEENNSMGVSRDQCGNCREHNRAHAQDETRPDYPKPVTVADPNHTRVYNPDGSVDVYDPKGDYVGTAPKDQPPTQQSRKQNVPW